MSALNISDLVKTTEEFERHAPDRYEVYYSRETREAFPEAFRKIERVNVGPFGAPLMPFHELWVGAFGILYMVNCEESTKQKEPAVILIDLRVYRPSFKPADAH